MPSERSLYRKIQIVLDVAKGVAASDLAQLRSEVSAQELPTFMSEHYDDDEDRFVLRVSERIVRKTLGVCRLLGLIGDDARLTAMGREASRRSRFDAVMSRQVRSFLNERHVSFKALNAIIRKRLQTTPPILPTSDELWRESHSDVPQGTFNRMLTLLAHCGAAESYQRRIYVHFDAE